MGENKLAPQMTNICGHRKPVVNDLVSSEKHPRNEAQSFFGTC